MFFLSFGPELKNGDPLSQDNFLAASFLADSAVVDDEKRSEWCVLVGGGW